MIGEQEIDGHVQEIIAKVPAYIILIQDNYLDFTGIVVVDRVDPIMSVNRSISRLL